MVISQITVNWDVVAYRTAHFAVYYGLPYLFAILIVYIFRLRFLGLTILFLLFLGYYYNDVQLQQEKAHFNSLSTPYTYIEPQTFPEILGVAFLYYLPVLFIWGLFMKKDYGKDKNVKKNEKAQVIGGNSPSAEQGAVINKKEIGKTPITVVEPLKNINSKRAKIRWIEFLFGEIKSGLLKITERVNYLLASMTTPTTLIVSIAILLIFFILFYKWASQIGQGGYFDYNNKIWIVTPFDFSTTWYVWIIFILTQSFFHISLWNKKIFAALLMVIITAVLSITVINIDEIRSKFTTIPSTSEDTTTVKISSLETLIVPKDTSSVKPVVSSGFIAPDEDIQRAKNELKK